MAAHVLVVHPPVSLGRDFIDYPWVADLGAVQLAAVMRPQANVTLVDSCALPGSSVYPLKDGRTLLGATVDDVIASIHAADTERQVDLAVVAFSPFHRPPARDGVLGDLLQQMRRLLGETPILLADCPHGKMRRRRARGSHLQLTSPGVALGVDAGTRN